VFTAYFDDTGGPDTYGVGAYGLIATADQWDRFSEAWQRVLDRPEFSLPYLHMKELRSGKGPFARFRDSALERSVLERVHCLIHARREASVGVFVPTAVYASLNKDFVLAPLARAFPLVAVLAIDRTIRWMRKYHPNDPIEFVFDQGPDGWDQVIKWCQRDGLPIPVARDKKTTPPLQAADHIAWECHRFHDRVIRAREMGEEPVTRGAFHSLMRIVGGDEWYDVTEPEVRSLLEKIDYPTWERAKSLNEGVTTTPQERYRRALRRPFDAGTGRVLSELAGPQPSKDPG
jgi:hypothetical protein